MNLKPATDATVKSLEAALAVDMGDTVYAAEIGVIEGYAFFSVRGKTEKTGGTRYVYNLTATGKVKKNSLRRDS